MNLKTDENVSSAFKTESRTVKFIGIAYIEQINDELTKVQKTKDEEIAKNKVIPKTAKVILSKGGNFGLQKVQKVIPEEPEDDVGVDKQKKKKHITNKKKKLNQD